MWDMRAEACTWARHVLSQGLSCGLYTVYICAASSLYEMSPSCWAMHSKGGTLSLGQGGYDWSAGGAQEEAGRQGPSF